MHSGSQAWGVCLVSQRQPIVHALQVPLQRDVAASASVSTITRQPGGAWLVSAGPPRKHASLWCCPPCTSCLPMPCRFLFMDDGECSCQPVPVHPLSPGSLGEPGWSVRGRPASFGAAHPAPLACPCPAGSYLWIMVNVAASASASTITRQPGGAWLVSVSLRGSSHVNE